MKAGLFMCDHVNPEVQHLYGDYSDMFIKLFPEIDFKIYDVINGKFPRHLDERDFYMATGSRHSAYDDIHWIDELKNVIVDIYNQNKYFIGFCFGHQLMGEALGGKVEKSPNGWCVGVHEFEMIEREKWMTPFQNKINLLMMCQDQVTRLPKDAVILASSDMCPVGMFKAGNKMLGVQAHPEFTKEYDKMLMKTRMNRMGDEVANRGIGTLQQPIHPSILRSWVLNFLS